MSDRVLEKLDARAGRERRSRSALIDLLLDAGLAGVSSSAAALPEPGSGGVEGSSGKTAGVGNGVAGQEVGLAGSGSVSAAPLALPLVGDLAGKSKPLPRGVQAGGKR